MAVTVERLSKPSLKATDKGWVWEPEWVVRGVATEAEAFTAVDGSTGESIPGIGATQGFLRCKSVEPTDHPVPGVWFMKAVFEAPEIEGIDQPEREKPRWKWDESQVEKSIAHDINGKPIVNSAGAPFGSEFSQTIPTEILHFWTWQPFYDPSGANALKGRANSEAMLVAGISVAKEQVLCKSIKPTSEQNADSEGVEVEYVFEIQPGYRPWQTRAIDWGHMGWGVSVNAGFPPVATVATGEFYHSAKGTDPVSDPVMLDGTGKPINELIVVRAGANDEFFAPVSNPNPPTHFEIAPESTGDYKVLIFTTRHTADFRGLLPPVM